MTTMTKVICVINAIIIAISLWIIASVIDTDLHNTIEPTNCSAWNIFQFLKKEEETPAPLETRWAEGTVAAKGVIITDDGHMWDNDTNETIEGTRIELLFNTHGTETVIDDSIIGYWIK